MKATPRKSLIRQIVRGKSCVLWLSIAFLLGCQPQPESRPPGWVDTERLLAADAEPENWMGLGRDFGESHYSPLEQINADNVGQLGLAWEYDARPRRGRTPRGMEATPIVVDGVLYASGPWGVVQALDARTGAELWRYDPEVDGSYNRKACCDVVNRGLAVWKGRIYVATLDGYLVSLQAESGQVVWKVDTFVDRKPSYTITSAPRIASGKVVIGNSGGEFGVRGYISAYDVTSGEFAWRFFIVPGDPKKGFEHPEMEMASKTWDPHSDWEAGGGGTVWGDMVYDPELNLLYVGTGNSSPYAIWFRSPSGGDNLFLASILAIDPDSGRLVWHYQTVPGEMWDYTATQHMILTDLEIDGAERKILMQAPKNGFFYVLDRRTGELLSAKNFVTVNWASHVDLKTGRPVLTGEGWYKDEPKLVYPSNAGAHNWPPMSYSPRTGLVYIPALDLPMMISSAQEYEYRPGELNRDVSISIPPFAERLRPYLRGREVKKEQRLIAWDPLRQEEVWSTPPEKGMKDGGALSTAGNLVFQGTASGHFKAYRADTGEKLLDLEVGTGIMAGPATYAIDGEQYVVVMAGFGGGRAGFYSEGSAALTFENHDRILAFKLGGRPVPLPPKRQVPKIPKPPPIEASPETVEQGAALYGRFCATCHGSPGKDHASNYPNLAAMNESTYTLFDAIVLGNALAGGGMASFGEVLDANGSAAIRAFLAARQEEMRGSAETEAPPDSNNRPR